MRRSNWFLLIGVTLALLLGAVALGWPKRPYLLVQSEGCGRRVVGLSGREFAVRFVHTIQKTEVIERFTVEPSGELRLFETVYSSLGVGLPDDAGLGFKLVDGRFKLKMDRRVAVLRWWVTPVAQQALVVGGKESEFTQFARPGELLTIQGGWSRRRNLTSGVNGGSCP